VRRRVSSFLERRGAWAALLALVFAFAYPMQLNGWNQNAHYALVHALADGTPHVDAALRRIGTISTGDVVRFRGHVYAAKAPGLAAASVPVFAAARALGMRSTGDPTRMIWLLHLWSIVLPAALMLLVVRRLADDVEPGLGTASAVTLGLGTLILPYATLFFDHVLAAALGAGAFAVLWRERRAAPSARLAAAAGALAGLAVTADYALGLVGVVLALYLCARRPLLRRAGSYALGAVVGALPLLAFDRWAFGSFTHLPYRGWDNPAGKTGAGGTYGFRHPPSLDHLRELLTSANGLLVATPVVACGVAGAVLLYRRRDRADALAILGVTVAYVLFQASDRFGGAGLPRYVLPIFPFLAVSLAACLRRFPLATIALAAISICQMVAATATGPIASDGHWVERVVHRNAVPTAASLAGLDSGYAIVPFYLAVAAAAVLAYAALPKIAVTWRDGRIAVACVAAWSLLDLTAKNGAGETLAPAYVALVALVGLAAAMLPLLLPARLRSAAVPAAADS
jgi:hypothetical protein